MNILDKIVANKKLEVESDKKNVSFKKLEETDFFKRSTISFKENLLDASKVGIIAEFKRQSPSKGIINDTAKVELTTAGYEKSGASALSILTDKDFFGGTVNDVIASRDTTNCPILRKEFIIDEYQIVQAKSIGADVILLLANVLSPTKIKEFSKFAKSFGLEILLEIREENELSAINEYVDAVGVNNRNLKDFNVNISQSHNLAAIIPDEFVKVSESGISDAKTIHELKTYGYKGFLMGETFMKQSNPAEACEKFINEVYSFKP